MKETILVIEDDQGIRDYIKELLVDDGYSVQTASTGIKGLELVDKVKPDLVLLDLKLPDIAGESICSDIKKDYPEMTVIILTAKDTPSDVVQGLDLGADDYVTKPFTAEELLARIRARLRENNDNGDVLKVSDLTLNTKTLDVIRGDKQIKLTPQEFKLLEYLMINKNQVLTRDMILNRIWSYSPDIETRVVDVYIGYLRKKIDEDYNQKLIQSVRGFGYVIKEEN